jgi:TPR repeat protein
MALYALNLMEGNGVKEPEPEKGALWMGRAAELGHEGAIGEGAFPSA